MRNIFAPFIIMLMASAIFTLFAPAALAQNEASVTFELKGGALSVAVTSPADVDAFQISIKAPSTVTLTSSQATLTGFMAGATTLSATSGGVTEYRWFKLAGSAGKTGTLSVPVTGVTLGSSITLDKVNLNNVAGSAITVGTYSKDPSLVSIATTTTTVSTTTTLTSTSTTTATTITTLTSSTTTTSTATLTTLTTATTTTTSTSTATTTVTQTTATTTTSTARTTTTAITTSTSTATTTVTQTTATTTTSTARTTTTAITTSTALTTQTAVTTSTATSTVTATTGVAGADTWMAATAGLAIVVLILLAVLVLRRQKA